MNEARAILGDVVTRLFTERVTRELRQSAEAGTWPDALWAAVEENGLTLPLVPEAQGGAGSTWSDAHVVVSAAGRHAVPLPLTETIVAAWLLAGAGLEARAGCGDGGRSRRYAEVGHALHDRAPAIRQADRRISGHPAEPRGPRRSRCGGGHRGRPRVPRGRPGRRRLRDRRRQGADGRGGGDHRVDRAPGPRRPRFHLRA